MTSPAARTVSARTKLFVNTILAVAFTVISAPHVTQIAVHEWLSVAFIALVVVHLLFSWNWIVGASRRFLAALRGTTRFNFAWDVTLYLSITFAMVSGILISESALPALGFLRPRDRFWSVAHAYSAHLCLVLVGVHLAMHWDWILAAVRRLLAATPHLPVRSGDSFRLWWIRPTGIISVAAFAVTLGTLALGQSALADRVRAPTPRELRQQMSRAARAAEGGPGVAGTAIRTPEVKRPKGPPVRASFRVRAKRTLVTLSKFMGGPFLLALAVLALVPRGRPSPSLTDAEVLEERAT